MIDRAARDALAESLRHLVSGQITNDEFEDRLPSSHDRAVGVVSQAAWSLYSDLHSHRLTGKRRIRSDGRETIARWILFLYSGLEYEWPQHRVIQIVNWPINLVTFGWWERRKRRKFEAFACVGEWAVWPFLRRTDFERLRRNPKLLAAR